MTKTCEWGRCTRKALYTVTEELHTETKIHVMCSQHRIATRNEGWSYGAIVRWVKL
jgi:hypothetical protein